jgi:hypothetical protein
MVLSVRIVVGVLRLAEFLKVWEANIAIWRTLAVSLKSLTSDQAYLVACIGERSVHSHSSTRMVSLESREDSSASLLAEEQETTSDLLASLL